MGYISSEKWGNTQPREPSHQTSTIVDASPLPIAVDTEPKQEAADYSEDSPTRYRNVNPSTVPTLALIEQGRMVDATNTQITIGWYAFVLNGFGLVILAVALIFNIKATNAAMNSAIAARLAIHGNRAWVTFKDLENCGFLDSSASQTGSPAFAFKLVNTGDTPARNISICALQSTCLRESKSEIIQPPLMEAYKETGSVGFLGKDSSYTTIVTPRHEDWIRYVKDNTHDIIFSLRITYETVHAGAHGCTIICKRVSHEQRTSRMYSVTIGQCCSLE